MDSRQLAAREAAVAEPVAESRMHSEIAEALGVSLATAERSQQHYDQLKLRQPHAGGGESNPAWIFDCDPRRCRAGSG